MGLVAVIARSGSIDVSEWLRCIGSMDALQKPKAKVVINPFTQEEFLREPVDGEAEIVAGGTLVGSVELSPEFEEDGELHVYACDRAEAVSATRSIAKHIARALDARLEWLDE